MSSNKIHIKVCGMRDESNINKLVMIAPDFIGFNFYQESARYVGKDFNPGIINSIPADIKKVGVFVKEDMDSVYEKCKTYSLDLAQLHGGETVDQCRELYSKGISLIKVFNVGNKFDFSVLDAFKQYCKYFLFDTTCKTYGGSGRKFNWDILEVYDNSKPLFLSGGIGIEDAELIKKLKNLSIHAVDINSRFETEPGIKDINKIKKFIQILKN
jgi:phosphoribosylanthranilate isomerase